MKRAGREDKDDRIAQRGDRIPQRGDCQGLETEGGSCLMGTVSVLYDKKSHREGWWGQLHNVNGFNTLSGTSESGKDGRLCVTCILAHFLKH